MPAFGGAAALRGSSGRGKAVGLALGSLLWASCVTSVAVALVFRLLGPLGERLSGLTGSSAAFEGGRALQSWGYDDDQSTAADLRKWMPLIQFGVFVLVVAIEGLTLLLYWIMFIKPTPDKYIPVRAIVPDDLKGKWKYDTFSCFQSLGTCCCFLWCPACTFGDLWYRAGWLHASAGNSQSSLDTSMPGWLFCCGAGAYCFAESVVGCCMCCGFAALRGGLSFIDGGKSDGGLGNVVPMRKRFDIPTDGANTFIEDCCCYCWCGPCVATQEYRQVMDLLNRGPVQEAPRPEAAAAVQVVGQPVTVQSPTVVQGAPQANNKVA